MKAAFEMLANSGEGDGDEDDDEDEEDDDDGQIDLKELKAFRDDDRKLNGKGVPEFIHQTDARFAGLTEEQRNHPDTKRFGGYKETADDKDYAKLYQHHVIELKESAVPEVQRKDCLYGFKATDEEIDAMALEADKDVRWSGGSIFRWWFNQSYRMSIDTFLLRRGRARLTTTNLSL